MRITMLLVLGLLLIPAVSVAQDDSADLREELKRLRETTEKLKKEFQDMKDKIGLAEAALGRARDSARSANTAANWSYSTLVLSFGVLFFYGFITWRGRQETLKGANDAKESAKEAVQSVEKAQKIVRDMEAKVDAVGQRAEGAITKLLNESTEEFRAIAQEMIEENISINELAQREDVYRFRNQRKEELETQILRLTKITDLYGHDVYRDQRASAVANLITLLPDHPSRQRFLDMAVTDFKIVFEKQPNTPAIRSRLARLVALRGQREDKPYVTSLLKEQFALDTHFRKSTREEATFKDYFTPEELEELTRELP